MIDVGMNKVTDEAMVRQMFGDKAESRLEILCEARLYAGRRRESERSRRSCRTPHARAWRSWLANGSDAQCAILSMPHGNEEDSASHYP